MKLRALLTVPLLLALVACGDADPAPTYEPVDGDFTIVLIPDTQNYLGETVQLFDDQVRWIAESAAAENIVFAIHLGDMTNYNTPYEWQIVDRIMTRLDAADVPWSPMPGNHDGMKRGIIDTALYNRHFGVERFAGRPWYGGHFGDGNDSLYALFEAGGMNLMVVSLAFGNPQEHLDWANEVIAAHPDRRVIVATHAYLDDDGTYLERGEEYGIEHPRWRDGRQTWEQVISRHPNVFMVVCGHELDQAYSEAQGAAGNVVHQILANYQAVDNGGNGYLRLLRFSPARDRIWVEAYSPPRDKYWRDGKHTFVVPLEMP